MKQKDLDFRDNDNYNGLKEETAKVLADHGIDKVKYYYDKMPFIGNLYTVCLLLKNNEIIARGISICSLLDCFDKQEGRSRSFKRAIRALCTKESSMPIQLSDDRWDKQFIPRKITNPNPDEFKDLLSTLYGASVGPYPDPKTYLQPTKDGKQIKKITYYVPRDFPLYMAKSFFEFKSSYSPYPTRIELQLLRKD